eukprot:TRINITY_DN2593_c0_g1_i1.p1 TRINITY_DN2593_c0_g1~~TRINITY_DN2593_c0_g1_i1.p1  ORF type:complete len:591 (+),score=96.41 TRINITY_DN2593_c0_g1_i1:70-1842(+)
MWVAQMSIRRGCRLLQRRNFSKTYEVSPAVDQSASALEPVDIVDSVSEYVIGQTAAKKEVAVAVRERWRRLQLPEEKSKEIVPKNILISGPSGCGKTEIIRRVSSLLQAPFVKVDASTFTRSGIVGASVNEIIVDLYDAADRMCKEEFEKRQDELCREVALDILVECVYNEIILRYSPPRASPPPQKNVSLPVPDMLKSFVRKGESDLIVVSANGKQVPSPGEIRNMSIFDNSQGTTNEEGTPQKHHYNSHLDEIEGHTAEEIGKMEEADARRLIRKHLIKLEEDSKKPTLTFPELKRPITSERGISEDLVVIHAFQGSEGVSSIQQLLFGGDGHDSSSLSSGAVADLIKNIKKRVCSELKSYSFSPERSPVKQLVENWGIVCIDEIDKVVHKKNSRDWVHSDVQKELLTLIEGTRIDVGRVRDERSMSIKMSGQKSDAEKHVINTTHILFVCAGAFATSKPTDMMVELLGRLPVRVKINSLTEEDLYKILAKNKYPMIEQQSDLLKTEGVEVKWDDDAVRALAKVAFTINDESENTGARVLGSLLRAVLVDYSYEAHKYKDKTITITKEHVLEKTKKHLPEKCLKTYIL